MAKSVFRKGDMLSKGKIIKKINEMGGIWTVGLVYMKIKVPVITSSELDVTRFSRREENSEMKSGLDDLGGRYIVGIMQEKELLENENRAQIDSKEEKVGIEILSILM